MTARHRVLFWVQHLLGIGHLRRAAVLARAMTDHGLDVTLVSGGMPVRGLDLGGAAFVQLPPLRAADAAFSALVGADGRPADEALLSERRARLVALHDAVAPHAVITEQFPFGRRQLRHEVLALLEAAASARPRPRVLCSVRDVLTEKRKAERAREMADCVARFYDRVLVHGDPALLPFDATFSETARIADRLVYTGYVAGDARSGGRVADADTIRPDVLVSAGGGAVGARLLETAIAARGQTRLAARTWLVLAGDNMPEAAFAAARRRRPPGIAVERARADFPALLRHAAVSVSQAGYNTVTDLLAAGTPAVLVPFAAPGETEQGVRAARMAVRGLAVVVDEEALAPESLAAAIDEAALRGSPATCAVRLDGAAATARLLRGMLGA